MDEKQRALLRKQEDERFVQACVTVVIAAIFELFLFQIKNYYLTFMSNEQGIAKAEFFQNLLTNGRPISIALMVGAVIWAATMLNHEKGKFLYPCGLFSGAFVFLAICQGTLVYKAQGVQVLMLLVPAWAGLGLIYFLYQVEFFISATFTSLGGISLWLYRQITLYTGSEEGMSDAQLTFYVFVNVALLLVLTGFYLVNQAWKNQGVLSVKKRNLTLISDMKDTSSLWLVGLSGVITLLALAISMGLSSATVAYYCTFALLGWLFVLFVYFTVKML